eukprot:jgi/Mesvir1/27716/Mv07419-RA.1
MNGHHVIYGIVGVRGEDSSRACKQARWNGNFYDPCSRNRKFHRCELYQLLLSLLLVTSSYVTVECFKVGSTPARPLISQRASALRQPMRRNAAATGPVVRRPGDPPGPGGSRSNVPGASHPQLKFLMNKAIEADRRVREELQLKQQPSGGATRGSSPSSSSSAPSARSALLLHDPLGPNARNRAPDWNAARPAPPPIVLPPARPQVDPAQVSQLVRAALKNKANRPPIAVPFSFPQEEGETRGGDPGGDDASLSVFDRINNMNNPAGRGPRDRGGNSDQAAGGGGAPSAPQSAAMLLAAMDKYGGVAARGGGAAAPPSSAASPNGVKDLQGWLQERGLPEKPGVATVYAASQDLLQGKKDLSSWLNSVLGAQPTKEGQHRFLVALEKLEGDNDAFPSTLPDADPDHPGVPHPGTPLDDLSAAKAVLARIDSGLRSGGPPVGATSSSILGMDLFTSIKAPHAERSTGAAATGKVAGDVGSGGGADKQGTDSDKKGGNADKKGKNADKKGADADKKGGNADKKGADADKKGADADKNGANADKVGVDAGNNQLGLAALGLTPEDLGKILAALAAARSPADAINWETVLIPHKAKEGKGKDKRQGARGGCRGHSAGQGAPGGRAHGAHGGAQPLGFGGPGLWHLGPGPGPPEAPASWLAHDRRDLKGSG